MAGQATGPGQLGPGEYFGSVPRVSRQRGLWLSEVVHRGARALPSHTHRLAYFSLLVAGSYAETLGRRTVEYRPRTVVCHPPHTTHRDEVGEGGGRFLMVEIEDDFLEALRRHGPLTVATVVGRNDEMAWLAWRLFEEFRLERTAGSLAVEGLVLQLLASAQRRREPRERSRPAWLGRVVERLHASLDRPAGLAELSREVGVHPVHIARTFRRAYGETIGEHLRKLRVELVARRLESTDTPLADLALEAGFTDQSHLTRVFKRLTGTTPAAMRRSLRRRAR
jgi:AraC family transcriptional regulator